jgi:predicted nucleic acid-binding protein
MIALDTNVWVRYVTNDDPRQARKALKLLQGADAVFVPKTVLLELEWVLRAVYELPAAAIGKALLHIAGLSVVHLESAGQVAKALDYYGQGLDFADALHLAGSEVAEAFYTFDSRFVSRAKTVGAVVRMV